MTFEPGQQSPYHLRRLTPSQRISIRAARAQGATVASLARAYGCTVRTIYRAIERADRPTFRVSVAEYVADFELADDYPVQITPWVPA